MYYKIRLLNNSIDDSTAEIVPYDAGNGSYSLLVYSDNLKMKGHLEQLVMREAFILSPGRYSANFYPDGVLHVYPGTVEYVQALPQILAWSGYLAEFVNDAHKSFDLIDERVLVLKSMDDNIYTNNAGERIVKRVPDGYIAVHTDGRAVAAGRWLNANIDKEDAEWQLVPNPYAEYTPEQRAAEAEDMEWIGEYHPGAQNELYDRRVDENDDFYYVEEGYQPQGGKKLSDMYPIAQPVAIPVGDRSVDAPHLPVTIPEGKILYSPATGHVLSSSLWPPVEIEGYETLSWYVFDDPGFSDDDKRTFYETFGPNPAFVPGTNEAIQQDKIGMPLDQATRLAIPGADQMDIAINPSQAEKLNLEAIDDPVYQRKAQIARERLSAIQDLVLYYDPDAKPEYDEDGNEIEPKPTLDPKLKDMEISDLDGDVRFLYDLYDHQKAGVLHLTETSQYEAYGGPKGWHGSMLNTYYGSGKVQPNDEVVYTTDGRKTMGAIQPGEYVLSEKGTPVKVLAKFPHKNWKFYRVEFDDGSFTEVGEEHLWLTLNQDELPSGEGEVRSTAEIRKSLYRDGKPNHMIPVTKPARFKQSIDSLPIAPYSLGRMLMEPRRRGDMLQKRLNVTASFIPNSYKEATVSARIMLLRGIIDGNSPNAVVTKLARKVNPPAATTELQEVEIQATSRELAYDIKELAASLGAWVKVRRVLNRFVINIFLPKSVEIRSNPSSYFKAKGMYRSIVSITPSRTADGACILVDSDEHLYLTRDYIVTHNTAMVLAADAIMRNRGHFESGEQVTIITAPSKNVYVWQDEIAKFRNERAIVIDGDRQNRIEQWEELLSRARSGTLPNLVITSSSKFRFESKPDDDPDMKEYEKWELAVDSQYMKLLAMGGTINGQQVRGGHIAAMAIDESGQFVNYDAARHKALNDIMDAVYEGQGIVWTMNGDLAGNSSTDTISEMSFVDKNVRDNYKALVSAYTKEDQLVRGKKIGRRVWRNGELMKEFLDVYSKGHIFSLDSFHSRREFTAPIVSELGKNWGAVYRRALEKITAAKNANIIQKSLGLLQIMLGASHGSVHPARMLEYGIGDKELKEGLKRILEPADYLFFENAVDEYLKNETEILPQGGFGRMPKPIKIQDRNKYFEAVFNKDPQNPRFEYFMGAMRQVLSQWDNPVADHYLEQVANTLSNTEAGTYTKIGITNDNRDFLHLLASKLRDRYGTNIVVNVIDGRTPSTRVAEIQNIHNETSNKHVITLVSAAGKYGLSLSTPRTIGSPSWNPATADQRLGRFHRKEDQYNLVTQVVPSGLYEYMRYMADEKRSRSEITRDYVLDIVDEDDEISFRSLNATPFLEMLGRFPLKVRDFETYERD